MYRLPDAYYTEQMLDGITPFTGYKQPSPSFNQGEDIGLSFFVNYEGKPLNKLDWNLRGVIKKSVHAENVLWQAIPEVSLFEKESTPGYYYFVMPGAISGQFLPGIYFFDLLGTQKVGHGPDHLDRTRVLLSATFNIELSASSPNPKLKNTSVTEVNFDPGSLQVTYKRTTVENTGPDGVDISLI